MSDKPKLDRTAFKIVSFDKKGQNRTYWLQKTPAQRLSFSWYLTCAAYNIPYDNAYCMDRTAFWCGKLEDRDKIKKEKSGIKHIQSRFSRFFEVI